MLKHPQTPRHLALPMVKHMNLLDLLAVALTPKVPADLKRLAEDSILSQLQGVALGQRLTLARRGSARVAAGLLLDSQKQVIQAALENPCMTDAALSQALAAEQSPAALAEVALEHPGWMRRRAVRLGMMRSRHLSLARFAYLLNELTTAELTDLEQDSRLKRNLRDYVGKFLASRRASRTHKQRSIDSRRQNDCTANSQ